MSDYIKITNYAAKDALLTGNPSKLVKGTEIGADFDAVAVAVATKFDSTDLGVTVQAYDADLTTWAGVTPGTGVATALAVNVGSAGAVITNGGALGTPSSGTLSGCSGLPAAGVSGTALVSANIGSSVQAYDANTAKLNVDQSWTGSQRGTPTTDNDLSFDQSAANNFTCTPTAGGALTFTNHTAGQSGFILLVNGSNYAITAAATTKVDSSLLATISVTGTYLLSYYDNGTNAYVVGSKALS